MDVLAFVKRKGSLQTLWLSVGTVLAGTSGAAIRGNVEVLPAILCLLFGIFAQLTANYYHAWYVEKGDTDKLFARESLIYEDEDNEQSHHFAVRVLKEAAYAAFVISLAIGFGLLSIARQPLWFILMGVIIYGQFYLLHAGKKPLINTPLSMVFTFLIFGPIGVISTSLIQSQVEAHGNIWNFFDTAPCIYIGCAAGFFALTVHYIFSYANYKLSPDHNKYNLTRLIGLNKIVLMTYLNGAFAFCLMAAMILVLHISYPLIAIIPAFIALMINTHVAYLMKRGNPEDIRLMFRLSLYNYVLTAALMLIIFVIIGPPDDSYRHLW